LLLARDMAGNSDLRDDGIQKYVDSLRSANFFEKLSEFLYHILKLS